jgi:hypothetical protein
MVTVFSFQGRRITSVQDYPSMAAAEAALAGTRPGIGGAVVAPVATRFAWLRRTVVSAAAPPCCGPAGRYR